MSRLSAFTVRALGAVVVSLAGWACAQPASSPDASGGYAQRYADTCAACHGPQGVSTLPMIPSLAGQPSFYAITQLFLFREGRRDNAAMAAVAKGLSDADLRGYSDLIGSLPPTTTRTGIADDARRARGAALAERHLCTNCHGADLGGGKQVPRLALQREDYLLQALRGFRAGTRLGYTQAMSEALSGINPAELEDLAHFLAHAGPPPK